MDRHAAHRRAFDRVRAAQYDWDEAGLRAALDAVCAPDAVFRLAHPFGDMDGPAAFHDGALAVLKSALPDVERRDWIVMAGGD
ncbi:MAG: polyketide cyclase, partial [Candidatus Puniceispirillaceae bacterium]